uniref:Hexamerin-like protein 1 n=1 Tax=Tetrix subulata TaxID=288127 RepID=A0A2I6SDB8_9ORTH|nr:hexamerin-like protein 1 [Tetrix subulata]
MRTSLAVAFALLATLAAARSPPHPGVGVEQLQRQRDVLKLYTYLDNEMLFDDVKEIAKTYKIEDNISHFKDSEVVRKFLNYYKYKYVEPKGEVSSYLYSKDFKVTKTIYRMLLAANDFETFFKTAVWLREHISVSQFMYAYTAALVRRDDTKDFVLPPPYEVLPQLFYKADVIQEAYEAYFKGLTFGEKPYIVNATYTGFTNPRNPEDLVSYFREDVGLISFFTMLHYEYPYFLSQSNFTRYPYKNRGERFLFGLRQLIARYDLERLSNGLPDVEPVEFDHPVDTGYYPKMRLHNGVEAPMRAEGLMPQGSDIWTMEQIKAIESRLFKTIDFGSIFDEEMKRYSLYDRNGMDLLGNLIEGNYDSINRNFYGSFYRAMLSIFGHIADPNHEYGIPHSILEQVGTVVKDPLFFRIVRRIVDMVEHYADRLPRYTRHDLEFEGLELSKVSADKMVTYFDDFETGLGNIMKPRTTEEAMKINIMARQPRLAHKPFSYHLTVKSNKEQNVFVRTFLGPRMDYLGRELHLDERRMDFVLLDAFEYKVGAGETAIERNSEAFSMFGPSYPSFYDIWMATEKGIKGEKPFYVQEYRHSMGYPQGLALPRGTRSGLPLTLFVFVTPATRTTSTTSDYFQDLFPAPDDHTITYPLDRHVYDFDIDVPNARFEDVVVVHRNKEDVANTV